MLPYYYTQLWQNHMGRSSTLMRPLFLEFPTDTTTYDINAQFLIGPGFLVSPVLDQGQNQVKAYLPNHDVWYDYYSHNAMDNGNNGWHTLDAPMNKINLHFRGGYIIPQQEPSYSIRDSRKNPFTIMVALDRNSSATGTLYLDDGDSIDVGARYSEIRFEARGRSVKLTPLTRGYDEGNQLTVKQVVIMGVRDAGDVTVSPNNGGVSHTFASGTLTVNLGENYKIHDAIRISY